MRTACAADLFILTLTHWIALLWEQSPPGSVRARRTWRSLWARASCFPARWQATRPWMYRSPGLSTAKSSARQTDILSTWEGWVWDEVEKCLSFYLFIYLLTCLCVFENECRFCNLRVKLSYLFVFFSLSEEQLTSKTFSLYFVSWILIKATHYRVGVWLLMCQLAQSAASLTKQCNIWNVWKSINCHSAPQWRLIKC